MKFRWGVDALLLAAPGWSPVAWGQIAPSPDEAPVSTASAQPEEVPVTPLKRSVNLVDVVFLVKDKAGNLVPHLGPDDCSVLEDKVPQTLTSFTAVTHLPLGLLLDTSGRQQRVLPLEQDAGSEFLEQVAKPRNEAFIVSVDTNVDLLQELTSNTRALSRALHKAEINAAAGFGPGPVPTSRELRGVLL
jgi:VWFA-related protein